MKYSFIALLLFFITGSVQAQKHVQLYGYVQPVTKGMAERNDKASRLYNYFMYLSAPSKIRIYPAEIWIKGERLGVKAAVVNTPVTILKDEAIPNSGEIILVPKTTHRVLQLTGTRAASTKNFSKAKDLAQKNELVVVYKTGGKFYYALLEKFSALGAGVRQ